ncbi:MAG: hypothetical protein PHC75_05575 [Burkholderiales bacterium]|nr:hypothetical protein [Burkholderiales bacterium]
MGLFRVTKLQDPLLVFNLLVAFVPLALLIDFLPDHELDSIIMLGNFIAHLYFLIDGLHSVTISQSLIILVIINRFFPIFILSKELLKFRVICYLVVRIMSIIFASIHETYRKLISRFSTVYVDTLFHFNKEVITAFISVP